MTANVKNLAKRAIHDKLESRINLAEAKLNTLKARAEAAKANVELEATREFRSGKKALVHKLHQLKKSDGGKWERTRADLETQIEDFEKSVKGIKTKARGKAS